MEARVRGTGVLLRCGSERSMRNIVRAYSFVTSIQSLPKTQNKGNEHNQNCSTSVRGDVTDWPDSHGHMLMLSRGACGDCIPERETGLCCSRF